MLFYYRWRNYIETEQNSVETLLATSFRAFCKDTAAVNGRQQQPALGEDMTDGIGRYHRLRADSFSSVLSANSSSRGRQSSGGGSSTATAITDLYSGMVSPLPSGNNHSNSSSYPAAMSLMMSRGGGYSHHGTLPRSPATARLVQLRTAAAVANNHEDACTNCGHHGNINNNSSEDGSAYPFPSDTQEHSPAASIWQSRPAMVLPDSDSPPVRRQSFSSSLHHQHHLPPGMLELETMYNAMKNLNSPLPNAPPSVFATHNSGGGGLMGGRMPAVFPMPLANNGQPRMRSNSLEDDLRFLGDNADAASLAGCCDIPPPPPPVQSHAVLESGLGHELPPAPRTPGALRKVDWSLHHQHQQRPPPPNIPLPPLPPKRTSSRLSDMMMMGSNNSHSAAARRNRPANLNISHDSDSSSIYSRPRPFLHRSSLMSTGSSDSGSCSSGSGPSSSSDPELQQLPLSPLTPSSELVFSWPNYSIGGGGSVSPTEQHHHHLPRSVSQIGCRTAAGGGGSDPDCQSVGGSSGGGGGNNSANTSMTSHSGVYVKMHRLFASPADEEENPDSPYMNLLYAAIQRQGGTGSVETAMSPYLSMTGFETSVVAASSAASNVKNLRNAAIDSVSAIYAQIDSSNRGSYEELAKTSSGVSSPNAHAQSKSTPSRRRESSSSSKSKALAEFRELMLEVERKRNFRVGLNLFNTHPEMGIEYLVKQNFLELSPLAVARFLYTTHGLARAQIATYLCQLGNAFCMKVLSCYLEQFDFSGLRIDKALRKLLQAVQVAGSESQRIEKLLEVFGKRYLKCNPAVAAKLKSADSIVTLAYAVVLLNTDLHTPNLKAERRMAEKDFVANLRGAEGGQDFDSKLLKSIYKAVKKQAFTSGGDHVTQAQLLQASMVGKTAPAALAEPHRRLVCLCRLADVLDINTKKEAEAHAHARDIWLFNDMLIVTKIVAGRTSSATRGGPMYAYRDSFSLRGTEVTLFHTPVYKYGVQISRKGDGAVLATLNAASEQDRYKFVMDLQESIFEMDVMERAIRDANMIK